MKIASLFLLLSFLMGGLKAHAAAACLDLTGTFEAADPSAFNNVAQMTFQQTGCESLAIDILYSWGGTDHAELRDKSVTCLAPGTGAACPLKKMVWLQDPITVFVYENFAPARREFYALSADSKTLTVTLENGSAFAFTRTAESPALHRE